MPTANRDTPVATTYARSLLELANEQGGAEQAGAVRGELRDLLQLTDAEPTFAAVVADPGVSESRRGQLLEKVFAGRASPLLMNFLRVLNVKGRLGVLREIVAVYDRLLDEQLGNVDVEVTVARELSDEDKEQVRQRVSAAIGRNAVIHAKVDESIIGGLILRVQDRLLDASVRQQLERMRQQLLAAGAKKTGAAAATPRN